MLLQPVESPDFPAFRKVKLAFTPRMRRLPHVPAHLIAASSSKIWRMPLLDRLYITALRLVSNSARAEDMVQETFLRAWQNFDRFSIGTNFKAWIFQILTYLFLNERRSANRRTVNGISRKTTSIEAPEPPDLASLRTSTVALLDGNAGADAIDWERLYPSLVDDAMKRALDRLPHRAARGAVIDHAWLKCHIRSARRF